MIQCFMHNAVEYVEESGPGLRAEMWRYPKQLFLHPWDKVVGFVKRSSA